MAPPRVGRWSMLSGRGRALRVGDGLRADPDVVRLDAARRAGPARRRSPRRPRGCAAGRGHPPAALDGVGLGTGAHQRTAGRAPGRFAGVGRVRLQLSVQRSMPERRRGGGRRRRGRVGGRRVAHADDRGPDVDCQALGDQQFGDGAGERRGQFDEGFCGLDFAQDIVDGHRVAGFDLPGDDLGLGQPFAHIGEVELVESHVVLVGKGASAGASAERAQSVGKGAVQCLEDAVDVRQVVFLHLGHRVGHVEAADADDGRLE